MSSTDRCPCGSGDVHGDCCARLLAGTIAAPTAEALMRSRFSAFAVGDAAYLRRTWHPSTRPAVLDLDDAVRWLRLDIVDRSAGGPFDTTGIVEFRAHYTGSDGRGVMHERSSFLREGGEWRYLGGDVRPSDE